MKTLMKCGCESQGTIDGKVGCLVHDCTELAETQPNLEGRLAKCHCGNTRQSSDNLAFFVYLGEGSPESKELCKCGYAWIAHQPRWRATIAVDRNWFKCPRGITNSTREFHAPKGQENEFAEREAEFFRAKTYDKDTEVFSATVISIKEIRSTLKCTTFNPKGPQPFDRYYCGCDGWD